MKLAPVTIALVLCTTTACTFFEQPLDDFPSVNAPASDTPVATAPPPLPPALPQSPPPVSGAGTVRQAAVAAQPVAGSGSYLTVATIFDVPDNVASLSFVHFTKRNKRREGEICQALLSRYPITPPSDVPANAASLIIWPVIDGSTANRCSNMIQDHEPLDISSATAAVVKSSSTGPFVMSRNTPQQKQMIYDLSSVGTGSLESAMSEWQRVVEGDVQSWPAVVNAR